MPCEADEPRGTGRQEAASDTATTPVPHACLRLVGCWVKSNQSTRDNKDKLAEVEVKAGHELSALLPAQANGSEIDEIIENVPPSSPFSALQPAASRQEVVASGCTSTAQANVRPQVRHDDGRSADRIAAVKLYTRDEDPLFVRINLDKLLKGKLLVLRVGDMVTVARRWVGTVVSSPSRGGAWTALLLCTKPSGRCVAYGLGLHGGCTFVIFFAQVMTVLHF